MSIDMPAVPGMDPVIAEIAYDCAHTVTLSDAGNWEFTSRGVEHFAKVVERRTRDAAGVLNLNDRFAVTLTEEGAKVMTAWYEQFPAAYRKSAEPGMVLKEPLWHLMQIFGAQMIMGREPVFVENKLELKEQG